MKKIVGYYIAFILCILGIFIGIGIYLFNLVPERNNYTSEDKIQYVAKVEGKHFLIYDENEEWKENFLTGVNLGAAKPGYFPGEVPITEDEYFEWFQMIQDMNCSVIRVYIPQTPEFYKALYRYNQVADSPLYLVQGVYVNENELEMEQNILAEDSKVKAEFTKDIKEAVDMIHGNAVIKKQIGKAYGTYTSDVSKYVIGWILGIEFSAENVAKTNEANVGRQDFNGEYVYTQGASPMEVFLAEATDVAISYETEKYQMQRPIAICNWVTTDPLEHPNEPNKEMEDAETIDVEHILAKEKFEPGFFASYHVYPYYPESIMYDTKYQVEGSNAYLEYLKELNAYHSMPVLISEFGIPTSRGITHIDGDRGFDQGNMSEAQQGEALSTMIKDIYSSGCMGGFIFSWQDEWFKRSWNTMDYDDPNRRPYWHDTQTSEQNFGLMAFEPVNRIMIDGVCTEWKESDLVAQTGEDKLYAKYDSSYLYLLAKVSDFENNQYIIPIDTISNQGNLKYGKQKFSKGADFVVVLSGKDNSKVLVDPYYNLNFKQYGELLYTKEDMADYNVKNSNRFIPITQVLNRKWILPETKEEIPFQEYDTGKLTYGINDPQHEAYDSLADFYECDNMVEIRIPWLLLNVADPSSKKIVSNLQENDTITFEHIDEIYLGMTNSMNTQLVDMNAFSWEGWQQTQYETRLKQSYYMVQESFANYQESTSEVKAYLDRFRQARINYLEILEKSMSLPFLVYLILLFGSMIFYLLFYLFIMNGRSKWMDINRSEEQENVRKSIKGSLETVEQINKKYLCSLEGLSMLNGLAEELEKQEKRELSILLEKIGYKQYLSKMLKSRNIDVVIQVIKLMGAMNYEEYTKRIVECMYKNSDHPDMQYNGLLALARMHESDAFITLCLDENHKKTISFRCLSEIIGVYSGDKKELCIRFLEASDCYIQRIAIRLIGENQYMDLENQLMAFLKHEDMNLRCDAIRALAELGSKKGINQMIEMTTSEAWQVINVIYGALAQLGLEEYAHIIKNGLYSSEWWVRYNTATLLAKSAELPKIYQEVINGTDQFAKEILQYAVTKENLQRGIITNEN